MDMDLVREIAVVLNVRSRENTSNTPDFVLAEYMVGCLQAYEEAVNRRDKLKLGQPVKLDPLPQSLGPARLRTLHDYEDERSPLEVEAQKTFYGSPSADRCNDLS